MSKPMDLTQQLYRTLKASGVPVARVSIGVVADKTTWRVELAPGADAVAKAKAQAIVNALDADKPDPAIADEDFDAVLARNKVVVVLIGWLADALKLKPADVRAQLLERYRREP